MDDLRQSILYGCLPVEFKFQSFSFPEQLEILRYIVAKPASLSRLRIQDRPDERMAVLWSAMTPPPSSTL